LLSSSSQAARRAPLIALLLLAPLWLTGMFGRGLWTPDEPREADMAWRMSVQTDRALPQLAGTPFLEKPPLSYWMAGGAIAALGDTAGAARAPNFLYAMVVALAIAALALAMELAAAPALIATLVAASALTAWRVTIWLAPDACLLAGCALALLGAWLGLQAPRGLPKAAGYALAHLGAAIGFMAKSAPGWLVPGLALLVLILWERRFSELRRWELYAGLALQALIIGPWLLAVAHSAHGAEALRTLFWNNLVGRFTQVAAPASLDYTTGHRNTPGKYLFGLPLYLLPWTLLVLAALVRAWRRLGADGTRGTAWRFALASVCRSWRCSRSRRRRATSMRPRHSWAADCSRDCGWTRRGASPRASIAWRRSAPSYWSQPWRSAARSRSACWRRPAPARCCPAWPPRSA